MFKKFEKKDDKKNYRRNKLLEIRPKKKCNFCKVKATDIDYKDVSLIGRYLNRWSKIENRHRSGNCARHQRILSKAIKRARYLAFLPYIVR